MALRLWLGVICFVPLAVVAADPAALLRLARWRARRRAQRDVSQGQDAPLPPLEWQLPALAWLPALLMAIIGTGLIGLVMIP